MHGSRRGGGGVGVGRWGRVGGLVFFGLDAEEEIAGYSGIFHGGEEDGSFARIGVFVIEE